MTSLSHNIKPNRKKAFGIALAAKERELTESEKDSLILYFAPSAPAVAKTAFQWAARAAAVKDVRHYLCFVHVLGGIMRASDGHRLHWAPTDLAEGYYEPSTGLRVDDKNTQGEFPDVSRVIPQLGGMLRFDGEPELLADGDHAVKYKYKYANLNFNKTYVDQANPTEAYLNHEAMRGASDWGEFVIMSIRG